MRGVRQRVLRIVSALRLSALGLSVLSLNAQAATDSNVAQSGPHIYERCAGCHSIEGNRTGPAHCGLFGRRAGTAPGYDEYSQAMRDSNIVWDERTLDWFLTDPMRAIPGTAMGYAGIKDAQERLALIAWLRTATRAGQACRLNR